MGGTVNGVVLEPAAQAFADAASRPPFVYEMTPDEARRVFDDLQAAPVGKPPVEEEWVTVPADAGAVQVRIVRPAGADGALPAVVYRHDSAGGNIAAALTLMAKDRADVSFAHQSLYYPVTDAGMDTGSYEPFATGYVLSAESMAWFWDAYVPDGRRRSEIYASPRRATTEQLAGLPEALVIVAKADVLRDEGEAYAAKLRAGGVPVTTVRYGGITHDFMMLAELRGTQAARAAIAQAAATLRAALTDRV